MPNRDLKIGDVVTLRSGGPKMTVINLEPQTAYTAWFGSPPMPKPEYGQFPVAALDLFEERR